MSSIAGDAGESVTSRWFWLDAEYRRACLWGMGGCFVFPLAAFVIQQWAILPRNWTEIAIPSSLGLLVLGRWLLPWVRVDETGVHARWWWTWDVWPWEEFQSGDVRLGTSLGEYRNSRRPWWRRKLSLDYLSPGERDEIRQLIERIRVVPAPGALPDHLAVTMEWPHSERVMLSRDTLEIRKRRNTFVYQWSEVRSVEVWQLEHGRPDFREIHLEVGEHRLRLIRFKDDHGMDRRNWKEDNGDELLRTFQRFVSPDRLLICAENSPPASVRELERRLDRHRSKLREFRIVNRTLSICMWLLTASMLVMLPWPGCLGMASFTGLLTAGFHAIGRFLPQSDQERLLELEQYRPALELADEGVSGRP